MSDSRSRGGIAEGTIRPARFVKIGTDEGALLECDANDRIAGVSFRETRRSDYVDSTAAPGVLANTGEPLAYYTSGADCQLEIAGTVGAGDLLESDNNGCGVTSSTDKHNYGAKALADGVSGEIIPVEVMIGTVSV